jgi:hypothetical protein
MNQINYFKCPYCFELNAINNPKHHDEYICGLYFDGVERGCGQTFKLYQFTNKTLIATKLNKLHQNIRFDN